MINKLLKLASYYDKILQFDKSDYICEILDGFARNKSAKLKTADEKEDFEKKYEEEITEEESYVKLPEDDDLREQKYLGGDFFTSFIKITEGYSADNTCVAGTIIASQYGLRIKHGAFRSAIILNDFFVLKLAKYERFTDQNKKEANLDPRFFPKVYLKDPYFRWIVVEKAEPLTEKSMAKYFPELKAVNFDVSLFLQALSSDDMDFVRSIEPGANLKKIIEFYLTVNPSDDLVSNNLGVVKRSNPGENGLHEEVVIIDAGYHNR